MDLSPGSPRPADDVPEVARLFGLGDVRSVTVLGGRTNENLLLETAAGRVVARRCRADKTAGDLRFEMAMLRHADGAGVPTAPILTAADGGDGVVVGGRIWTVAGQVAGDHPGKGTRILGQVGTALGLLHASLAWFEPPAPAPRPDRPKAPWRHLERIPAAAPAAVRELAAGITTLDAEVVASRPPATGLIHGGWRRSNTLVADGRLRAVLDFDSARADDAAADVALMLWSFCRDRDAPAGLSLERMEALAEGYGASAASGESLARAVPVLVAEAILFQAAAATAAGDVPRAASRLDAARRCMGARELIAAAWNEAATGMRAA